MYVFRVFTQILDVNPLSVTLYRKHTAVICYALHFPAMLSLVRVVVRHGYIMYNAMGQRAPLHSAPLMAGVQTFVATTRTSV